MTSPRPAGASRGRDWRLFLVIGAVVVIGPAAMDVYLPGMPELARDFGATPSATQVTITTFLLGLALGQLVSGPLSDVVGRRRPLIGGMALFAVASLVCSLAPSLAALAALRFVQGALAAAGMAIGRAAVRDMYEGAAAARYLSRLILIIGLGPVLAPLIGGQLLRVTSWRGVFVALAVLGLAVALLALRFLPETLAPENRRAAGLGLTVRSFGTLLGDRRFVGFVLIIGLCSGAVVAYIAGSSFVLEGVYGVSPQLYGLLFGINAVFLVLGAQMNAHLLGRFSPRRLLAVGLVTMLVAAGSLVAVVELAETSVAAVMPPFTLVMLSWSFVQSNATALALTDYPRLAGTAAALLGVSQFAFGAVMAPLVGLGGDDTAWPIALAIAVCSVGAAAAFVLLVPAVARRRLRPAPSEA
ncbi:MAG TPA: multidrug effflux MFS transporter [Gaiellaceae bacterium]|nr:multidrug effflux MFS transporter [Gaiellaceae bacterium]